MPRCGEALTAFTLAGREAVVCEACGYVGVPADHRPPGQGEEESWGAALDRFREDGTDRTEAYGDDEGGGKAGDREK